MWLFTPITGNLRIRLVNSNANTSRCVSFLKKDRRRRCKLHGSHTPYAVLLDYRYKTSWLTSTLRLSTNGRSS
jgi:hypothetical protein